MIRYRKEGEPVRNGINLYHKDDPSSKGAVSRIGNLWLWTRYSYHLKKWIIKLEWRAIGREYQVIPVVTKDDLT